MTRSRLQRVLDPIVGYGTNIIGLAISNVGSYNHSQIQQLTMTRGSSSGRAAGYNPATLEATVIGRDDTTATGHPARVFLRDVHVQRLADYVGVPWGDIVDRYVGRLGMVTIDDQGKRAATTFTAASWMVQLQNSPRHVTPQAGETIGSLLNRMTFMDDPVRGTSLTVRTDGALLQHHEAGEPTLFKEAVSQFAQDVGIVMQEQRDGTTVAWGHAHREWWAANRMSTQWPLMRSNAIAPATYEQMGERPAPPIDYTVWTTGNYIAERSIEPPNHTGETVLREEVDWTAWRVSVDNSDSQLWREAWSRAHTLAPSNYTIPSITVDLLMLLRQGTEYARKIAGQMLTLEAGEPVYLSGDWPQRLRGVHYAEGITETITPDGWTIELSLIPHAVGAGTPTPEVPPIAWDSFLIAWDEETRNWNL